MDPSNVVSSCADKLIGVAQDHVLKHLCYVVKVGDNVRSIGVELVRTRRLLVDIKSKFETEERHGRKPTAVAQGWIADAEKFEADAEKIQQVYDRRGCTLCGFQGCSFNICASYRVGKEAAEMLDEVKELLKKGDALLASNLATEEKLPPPVQVIPTSTKSLGFELYLATALRFLKEEDCKYMLGIWGTGGVGKTTLLTEINNLLARNPQNFHHVIHVVASQGCTIEKIQVQIINQLRLPDDHSDVSSRANTITNYLIFKNFLLLLDDVWEYQDLEEVGIPYLDRKPIESNRKKRKIILVSRNEDKCRQMGAKMMIHVDVLKGDDAWRLFEEKVRKATIKSHPSIQGLAEKVVEECGGLPLALVTIGRAMSNTKDPHGWRHAIRQLQRSQQISGTEDKLFSRLKLSYDYLKDDRTRDCFLHCALWPEDHNIREDDLIECWIGHGLINGFNDINEACDIGHTIIENLKEADLLKTTKAHVDIYALGSTNSVRMHDVIRDMALWIARDFGANLNKWIVSPREEVINWKEAHKFSNMGNLSSTTLFDSINASCPDLTTLMLPNNYFKRIRIRALKFLPFFHNLKYLDMSHCGMRRFPLQICRLATLEYLNLSYNRIHSVPVDARNLENLKHLNLFDNIVSLLPKGLISNLTKLQVLDVCSRARYVDQESIIDQLHCIEHGRMKALGINASSTSQVQKLKSIPITRLRLHGMHDLRSLLSSPLLGSHNIQCTLRFLFISQSDTEELVIEGQDQHPLEYLETLWLGGLRQLKEIIWNIDSFPAVTRVVADHCLQLKHMTWILHLPCLEVLVIHSCENMKEVISEELTRGQTWPTSLSSLKRMDLGGNDNMACISSSAINFPSLNHLVVVGCPNLKKLPFGLREGDNANLQMIEGGRRWWDNLCWEEPNIKDSLLPIFRETPW